MIRTTATVALVGNSIGAFLPFRAHLVRALAARGHRVVALYPGAGIRPGEKKLGIPGVEEQHFQLDTFSSNPLKDYRCLRSLRERFRAIQPSHVLSFTIKPVVYSGMAAAMERIPFSYSLITGLGYLFTGNSPRRALLRKYAEWMYAHSLSRNSLVFFQNPDDLELFVRKRLVSHERTVIVAGSGVDTEHFSPRNSLSNDPMFSFVGRLLWDKGLGDFAAAAELLSRNSHVRMIVAGPTSENPAGIPRRTVEEWVQRGIIEYRGHVQDVRSLMAESWGLVLPSYREGCSRAIQEALSMGRPVITTDVPGCRDSIVHGEHGLIVPPRDPHALAEAISCLVRSPSLRAKMGGAGRTRAVELYDQEKITNAMIAGMEL